MAKYRPIMIKIWNDSWFLSLSDSEKVFWFFLLTNPYFHISGIYELPKPLISSFPTSENMLSKFEKDGKITYKDGWIFIKNYLKNQTEQLQKNDNIYKSIFSYLSENPKLVEMFNLTNEDPYKTLIRPLGKVIKSKVIKSKDMRLPLAIPFPYQEELAKWLNDEQRHIRLVARLFQLKNLAFDTKAQMVTAAKRHFRAARQVAEFSNAQIEAAWERMSQNKPLMESGEWTLETVLKYLTK